MAALTELPPPTPPAPPSPSFPPPPVFPPPVPAAPRPPAYRPPSRPRGDRGEPWFYVALLASGLTVVAAFLPWITAVTVFGDVSRSGVDGGGDGVMTGLLGLAVALIALTTRNHDSDRGAGIAIIVCALIVVAISVYDLVSVNDRISDIDRRYVDASVGIGLYLTIAAGISGVVAGVLRTNR